MSAIANFAFNKVENFINNKFQKNGLSHQLVEFDEYHVDYWDSQKKAPICLLIHGFGAEAKYQWLDQIKFISESHRIVMPNLLHFGKSYHENGRYTVQDQVEFVLAFLNHLEIEKATFIGASYGGLVTMEFARQFPERVNLIAIQGAPVKYIFESDQKRVEDMFRVKRVHDLFVPPDYQSLNTLISASNGKKSYIPNYFLKPFHAHFYGDTYQQKLKLMNEMIRIRESYANYNYELDLPVHLIWGSNDPVVPLDRAYLLKDHLRDDASLDVIQRGGHMANMVKPKTFNGIINGIFRSK